ncbi:tetratricopeptide repeat protein [Sphingomonas sp. MA1305]|uniref:tetratricopeptide repeat-containing sulfotransferase family protein n=1 Tax=Sphingomonas sp. MA1305 TaxID=2479204 RepID=UPI0018E01817|nr:sulfotransferase [Sphingomonas sp. MA1305]MBI0475549.1 tetratricopeptide repeat protein [Sphingomonas sp. MA1305]
MTSPSAALAALQTAFGRRDRRTINAILYELLDRDANIGDRWPMMADVLAMHGEWTLAIRASERAVSSVPNDRARRLALAAVLARSGRHDAARAALERLLTQAPDDAVLHHFAGALASEDGRFDAAEDHFRRALARFPASGQTWLELAAIHTFTLDDPLFAQMRDISGKAPAVPLHYALGKAWHDVGEFDRAFADFIAGARIVAKERPYDAHTDRREAEAAIAGWRSRALPGGDGGAETILITGLPRSGSTLAEQILSSHPRVAAGGELNVLPILLGDRPPDRGDVDATADEYRRLVGERLTWNDRVADKTLDLGRRLGQALTVLPGARLIWMRRAPLDLAWSCLRTYFAQGVPWSWDQQSIARHIRIEEMLLSFWRERLGDRLLVVDYEALTADPTTQIRRMEEHVGLDHDEATLAPHHNTRPVLTSSVWQVRQPLSRRGVGVAEPYRRHLEPFLREYEAAQSI